MDWASFWLKMSPFILGTGERDSKRDLGFGGPSRGTTSFKDFGTAIKRTATGNNDSASKFIRVFGRMIKSKGKGV